MGESSLEILAVNYAIFVDLVKFKVKKRN